MVPVLNPSPAGDVRPSTPPPLRSVEIVEFQTVATILQDFIK
ncbi:hypothetical protein Hanom_Chr06g00575951 [Helianthus anomalus]